MNTLRRIHNGAGRLNTQTWSLSMLKKRLMSNPVMSYFHLDSATDINVDASPFGVGVILGQTNKEMQSGVYKRSTYPS